MSIEPFPSPTVRPSTPVKSRKPRRDRSQPQAGHSLLAEGKSMIWLTGGALALCLFMITGLLGLILWQGLPTFWPVPVVQITTSNGAIIAGEVSRTESYRPTPSNLEAELSPEWREAKEKIIADNGGFATRRLVRTANFELTNSHFEWVSDFAVKREVKPEWMVVFERLKDGRFYGEPVGYITDGERRESKPEEAWEFYEKNHDTVLRRFRQRVAIERDEIGAVNRKLSNARERLRLSVVRYGDDAPEVEKATTDLVSVEESATTETARLQAKIDELNAENNKFQLIVRTAQGQEIDMPLEQIVRAYRPNRLDLFGKISIYLSRWWEFLSANPRAVNMEGGVFPAIFGTVAMTLIMSLAVTPFGVLAALYLREYAKSGFVVSLIRIAINNLAGVPSIVFGVFGLGFFCYLLGAYIDGGPRQAQIPTFPPITWYMVVGLLAITAVGAFVGGVLGMATRAAEATARQRILAQASIVLWLISTALLVVVIATTPYFGGFFPSSGGPVFAQGGLLWAALTLSLLTLPVVIVATEEALAAVPNSMREGSYACGAGKWQTILRIVLPHAMPGIMTGMILAMSRGAGEAAPLMLVGALKSAPKLPIDLEFPFVHADRPFMHLAFHVFDLGFHSPNSEAAKPMVFTTALLLIAIVATLNLSAVWLRARLRKAFTGGQF